ncbi:MAG: M20/M25/M40 family metallo-hydrolase [Phycisphaerales bacterium]
MRTIAGITAISLASAALAGPPLPKEVMSRINAEIVGASVSKLAGFGTRHTLSDTASDTRGIGAARRWLKAELESYNHPADGLAGDLPPGRLEVFFEEFDAPKSQRLPDGGHLVNVVAVLPGKMPEAAARRYYVVGHYDSRNGDPMDVSGDAPGANDDASGTAVVLACARALARVDLDATIVFLCTAGEEQGLIGARYHAEQAVGRAERIMGVLSNDIVGDPLGPGGDFSKSTPHLIRVFSEGIPRTPDAQEHTRIRNFAMEMDSPGRQLARYLADVAEREVTTVKPMIVYRIDRFLRGGDHTPFLENGVPAVRFTEVDEDYNKQHQNVRMERKTGADGKMTMELIGDLPVGVDTTYLCNVAKLNAAALVHLANAPSPPTNARIITAELSYDTTIRWTPSPEPDVAGYEIVWRETTSAVWQKHKDVIRGIEVKVQRRAADGTTTEATDLEATVPVNKDNYFLGVRAYDKEGYRSPVSFPLAARE